MLDRERLIKQAEATYVGSSLPWLWERERRAIAHGVDAVLSALPAEPAQAKPRTFGERFLDLLPAAEDAPGPEPVRATDPVEIITDVLWRNGLGPMTREQANHEAVRVVAALATDPVSERLREALVAFAKLADQADEWRHSDDSTCMWRIRARHLRAARAALGEQRIQGTRERESA